jgi:hypothetical protein
MIFPHCIFEYITMMIMILTEINYIVQQHHYYCKHVMKYPESGEIILI